MTTQSMSASYLARMAQEVERTIATRRRTHEVTTDTTLRNDQRYVRGDATGGAITITLPVAQDIDGEAIDIKRINSGANAVTIACQGDDTIEGQPSIVLTVQWQGYSLRSHGTGYDIF